VGKRVGHELETKSAVKQSAGVPQSAQLAISTHQWQHIEQGAIDQFYLYEHMSIINQAIDGIRLSHFGVM